MGTPWGQRGGMAVWGHDGDTVGTALWGQQGGDSVGKTLWGHHGNARGHQSGHGSVGTLWGQHSGDSKEGTAWGKYCGDIGMRTLWGHPGDALAAPPARWPPGFNPFSNPVVFVIPEQIRAWRWEVTATSPVSLPQVTSPATGTRPEVALGTVPVPE